MAEVRIPSAPRGEMVAMEDQTASSTNAIDIEIKPDAACLLNIGITKPTGAVLTVKKKFGSGGATVDLIVSADATSATNVLLEDIPCATGDQIEVNIDTTSGDKVVSAQARRLPQ